MSCVTRTRHFLRALSTITLLAAVASTEEVWAQASTIACSPASCSVQAGYSLPLTGEAALATQRYHEWRYVTPAGVATTFRIDTGATSNRSTFTYSADGFQAAGTRTITLNACTTTYNSGTCALLTRDITITAAPPPAINCSTPDCSVLAGSTITLGGDSSAARFRYHQFTWTNSTGGTVTTTRDTAATSWASSAPFSTSGFPAGVTTPIRVTLNVCTTGYGTGSCASSSQIVNITALPLSTISCSRPGCRVLMGTNMVLTGDSQANDLRYHSWSWNNSANVAITPIDVDTLSNANASRVTFDANGFTAATTRTITLTSCSGGYRTGTCTTTTQVVSIDLPPAPTIGTGAGMPFSVQAGRTITLIGDSLTVGFRYHQWRLPGPTGTITTYNWDTSVDARNPLAPVTLFVGPRSTATFNAAGFGTATNTTVNIQLTACTGGYGSGGSCITATRPLTVLAQPLATITCPNGMCSATGGASIALNGDSGVSQLRYHEWRYPNSAGTIVATQFDTDATGYRSTLNYSLVGWNGSSSVTVELHACGGGYRVGTCTITTQVITISAAPVPVLGCNPSQAVCTVRAGQTIEMTGDSSATRFRYHDWQWRNSANTLITTRVDTNAIGFSSRVVFDATGFVNTMPTDIVADLAACTGGYRVGSCATATRIIRVLPPAPSIITCNPANCRVVASQTINLTGSSTTSQLRYHRWTYTSAANVAVTADRDTLNSGFTSGVSFLADPFNAAGTRVFTLNACSGGYAVGTCIATTRTVNIDMPAAPAITCPAGGCTVQAGLDFELLGDSSASRYPYHRWTWPNSAGTTVTTDRNALNGDFGSRVPYSANGYAITANTSITATLQACSTGYNAGSCLSRTQTINITPAPANGVTITCNPADCSTPPNSSVRLFADSVPPRFGYHRWSWVNTLGTTSVSTYDASLGGYNSTLTFSGSGWAANTTRVITFTACATGFATGTCYTVTRNVPIIANPAAIIRCDLPTCMVAPDQTMVISGDTRGASRRYHRWTWLNAAGTTVTTDLDTVSSYLSNATFNAAGFTAGPTTRTITLQACTTGFGTGTCSTDTQDITVGTMPAPVTRCSAGTPCNVPAGSSVNLSADSGNSGYRWHEWTWLDSSGNTVTTQRDTDLGANASAVTFSAAGFNVTAATTINARVNVCKTGYNTGHCVSATIPVIIQPSTNPVIECEPANCQVIGGLTIRLTGDSLASRLRYHEWRWRPSDTTQYFERYDTLNTGFRSSTTFNADGFAGSSVQPVELWACSTNYRAGTCVVSTQNITVLPAANPIISCVGNPTCTVQSGQVLRITADASAARFGFHEWTWPNPAGGSVLTQVAAGTTEYRSTVSFASDGNQLTRAATVAVSVSACDQTYRTGACTFATRVITIQPAPQPTISCVGGTCSVAAGVPLGLFGDSSNGLLRWHRWTWADADGSIVQTDLDALSSNYRTAPTFSADGFQTAGTRAVTLQACQSGYGSGTCASRTIDVTIRATANPVISCEAGSCSVIQGNSIRITGDTNGSLFPYHEWRWPNAGGTRVITYRTVAAPGYRATVTFSADGYQVTAPQSVNVELLACALGYGAGSCVRSTQAVTVRPAADPLINCDPSDCRVMAGQSMRLIGTSSAAFYRWHEWSWPNRAGGTVITQIDTVLGGYASNVVFSAAGFAGTGGTAQIELVACSSGYRTGSCTTSLRTITVVPPPNPIVNCGNNTTCTVIPGGSLVLTGDSSLSLLRYHEWRWTDASGSRVVTQLNTVNTAYRGNVTFSAAGFGRATAQTVTAELTACGTGYMSGTCVRSTLQINVTPLQPITINCFNTGGAGCTVPSGGTLVLTADASAAQLLYFQWRWLDVSNTPVITQDTGSVGTWRSDASFVAAGYRGAATRTVEVQACSATYNSGTCATASINVIITPAVPGYVTCNPSVCRVYVSQTIDLLGDTSNSALQWHEWRWTDSTGTVVTTRRDAGASYRSMVTFPATNYAVNTTRNVDLVACSAGYNMGTCQTITRPVIIDAAPGSRISCASGATCFVQAGLTLGLTGDSSAVRYPYHAWSIETPNGGFTNTNLYNATTYRTTPTLNAAGFNVTAPTTINVELVACTTGYRTGNCSSRSQPVTIQPAPAADINCGVGVVNCRVQAGQSIALTGDGTAASFRWHRWTWREADNLLVTFDRDGGTIFQTAVTFNSSGFEGTNNRTITLQSCSTGYASGTCTTTTRNLEIYAPPAPIIRCSAPMCQVRAGGTIQLEGDTVGSLYRYHQWRWINSAQTQVITNVDTAAGGYASTISFPATDFEQAQTVPVTVSLVACTGGYGFTGSCISASQVVTILPAAPTSITCNPATCTVQGGLTMQLFGDARQSSLGYLQWRWRNATGSTVVTNQYVGGTGYVGTVTFNADGFTNAASRTIEVIACSSGYRTGACVNTSRTISVEAAPAPSIGCTGGVCEVISGATLQLNGDSINSQYPYHDWRWADAAGRTVVTQLLASGPSFRSTTTFNASGFQGAQPVVVSVELQACDQGYRAGACAVRTQSVTVQPAAPASIICDSGATCPVEGGLTVEMAGDSSRSGLEFHTWRWRDATGTQIVTNRNTLTTGFRSTVVFSAVGFSRTATRAAELTTCSDSYGLGTCITSVQRVNIEIARDVDIGCASGATCEVTAGNSLNLTGDSSDGRLGYHEWHWPTPSGTQVVRQVDTNASLYLSTVPFSANGFPGDRETRVTAELVACSAGYRLGTCSTSTREILITPLPEPQITCVTGAVCSVQAGYTLGMVGATRGSTLRWHSWRWLDSAGAPVFFDIDGGTGPLSSVTFNAAAFSAGSMRAVTMTACTNGYGAGTCRSTTVNVLITAPQPLAILCNPSTCAVQPGFNLVLTGDATDIQARYHRWRWNDANGTEVVTPLTGATTTTYQINVTFPATGFTAPATRTATLEACTTGYGTGTCQTVTQLIRIEAAPLPTVECTNSPTCTIQQGLTVNLIGDSSPSLFPYHEYRWRDAFNNLVTTQLNGATTGYSTAVPFNANGFQGRTNIPVEVELVACQTNYRTGSCATNRRTVTVVPAPLPTIDCLGDFGCSVQAGATLVLRGGSVGARFPFHSWRWRDGTRTTINTNFSTAANGYLSTANFATPGYAANTVETIELTACAQGYRTGTCNTSTIQVRITAPPAPTMLCVAPAGCPVQAGQPITLQADAGNSLLRYHEWRWPGGSGETIITQRDTVSGAYISTAIFNTAGYNVTQPTTVRAEVTACSNNYRLGSCAVGFIDVRVLPAADPVITCEPSSCRLQAGTSIILNGNSNSSLFRWHEWQWRTAAGIPVITRVDAGLTFNRSTATFSAAGFNAATLHPITLFACSTGYRSGSCVSETRNVSIESAPAPSIVCGDGSGCSVRAGGTINLLGDAFAAQLGFHEWRWTNATGALVITQRSTAATSYRASVTFSAARFQNASPTTIRAELITCSDGYSLGTCTSRTQDIIVTPPSTPSISCLSVAGCTLPAGATLGITASSGFAGLRYHEWQWADRSGALVITQLDTAGTAYRSTVTFSAVNFLEEADSRVVSVTACSNGYRAGTCTTANLTVVITARIAARVTCNPLTCRTRPSGPVRLTADGVGGRYRYHEWRWTNASNAAVVQRLDGTTTYRTTATFSGAGFTTAASRVVTLTACTLGYRLGQCTVVTRTVVIDTRRPPTVTCAGGPCTVRAGSSIRITVNASLAPVLRYHDVRWEDSAGQTVRWTDSLGNLRYYQYDTYYSAYRSNTTIGSHGFQTATTIPVRIAACDAGYYAGNCGTLVQPITVIAPGPSNISCNPTTCRVTAGRTLPLIGTSTASRLRYHEFTWRDAAGNLVATRRDTAASSYRSSVNFPALGFQSAQSQTIELSTCSAGYRLGTCVYTRRNITIEAAPPPGIVCSSGIACDVQAGLTINLTGYARTSRFRYHEWRWANASGATVITQRDGGTIYRTTVPFTADNYNLTANTTRRVELTACDQGYRAGICVRNTQDVTIRPAPQSTIICGDDQPCVVQAGSSILLTGDSLANRFLYHEWRWLDASGVDGSIQVITQRNTTNFGYRSSVTFNSDRFRGDDTTRDIQLIACNGGFGAGACVTTTRVLTIRGAPAPEILCLGPDGCNVRQGRPLDLGGDAANSGFRWHEWRFETAFGSAVFAQIDTLNRGWRSQATFSADDFEGQAPYVATVRLNVCTGGTAAVGYGLGSCVTATRQVNVLPALPPSITCLLASCEIPSGQSTDLYGDSRDSLLRYHTWLWQDVSGATIETPRDTLASAFRSTVTFTATGFAAQTTRNVTLIACASGYRTGTCSTTTRPITIRPAEPVYVLCNPRTCQIQIGSSLALTGNSVASGLQWHRWRWMDANGTAVVTDRNTTTSFVSSVTFPTTGFLAGATRTLTLNACSTTYDTGTCQSVTRTITIGPAPQPDITCASGPGCTVQMGLAMDLAGDSDNSQYRYHDWRWLNSAGVQRVVQVDSFAGGYLSVARFDAAGFVSNDPIPVSVELVACTGNGVTLYRAGQCASRTITITVTPMRQPVIRCATPDCSVQRGLTLNMVGTATIAQLGFHDWRYPLAPSGTSITQVNATLSGYRSSILFNANNHSVPTFVNVDLSTCAAGYRTGSCAGRSQVVTITEAPRPDVSCLSLNGLCEVPPGQRLEMVGNSFDAQFRYHDWRWVGSNGLVITPIQRDTVNNGFGSTAFFNAAGFNPATRSEVPVTLTACTNGYLLGSCTTRIFNVTILPPIPAIITCDPGSCRVQAGADMDLIGDSSGSTLRFHRWSWRNAADSADVVVTVDAEVNGFESVANFDANGYNASATRDITLTVCSDGYGTGTCATTLRRINIDAAPRPIITCEPGSNCRVPAGDSLDLTGSSTTSQFRYHSWRWTNGSNVVTTTEVDAEAGNYRSTVAFSALGFPAEGNVTAAVELMSCTGAGRTGSCSTTTINVTVTPLPPAEVGCSETGCRVQAGNTLTLAADGTIGNLRYHEWRWNNAANVAITPIRVDTLSTDFNSTVDFNADGFNGAASRTVTLIACNTGYLTGTCSTVMVAVTVYPAADPVLTCASGPGCRVVAGQALGLTGTSSIAGFPFHEYRWNNSANTAVATRFTVTAPEYTSAASFPSTGFSTTAVTNVPVTLVACKSNYNTGSCVQVTRTVTIVPTAGTPQLISTSAMVTPLSQPERANYTFESDRPADWTVTLVRRVNASCTTDVLYRRTATGVSGVSGTWVGLSPGGSYCWTASITPAGAMSTLTNNFTLPALPTFTAGPASVVVARSVTITATASAPGTGSVEFDEGACTNRPTSLGFGVTSFATVRGPVLSNTEFAVEAWLNLNGVEAQDGRLLTYGGAGGMELQLQGGALRLVVRNPTEQDVVATSSVPSDRWVHVAASYRAGQTLRVFVNGANVGSDVVSTGAMAPDLSGLIIGDNTGFGFIGEIASLAVYPRELTTAELQAHFTAGPNVELPGEMGRTALWTFGEAAGVQSLYDAQGNHWAGVLGTDFRIEADEPDRRPALPQTAPAGTGTSLRARINNLIGGPAYCYRVRSETAVGVISSLPFGFVRGADTVPPVVNAPSLFVAECQTNESAVVSLDTPVATDDEDPEPDVTPTAITGEEITFPAAFPLGSSTVRWVAVDLAGNRGTADTTVRVRDITRPVVEGGDPDIVEATSPMGTPYTPQPESAGDSCSAVTVTSNAPATFPLGDTTVSFTVTDRSGNVSTAQRVVRVVDTTAPVFDPPLDTATYAHDGSMCFQVALANPPARDNGYARAMLTYSSMRLTGPGSPTCWDEGMHVVQWTVSDPAGNTTVEVQTVVVRVPTAALNLTVGGLTVGGQPAQALRWYNRPVSLGFTVRGGTPPYAVSVLPEPTNFMEMNGVFTAVFDADGDYSRLTINVRDGGGSGDAFATATVNGFGIDRTAPVIEADLISQQGVEMGRYDTYPPLFIGEELSLERIKARDGATVPSGLDRAMTFDGGDVIVVPEPANGLTATGTSAPAVSIETWLRVTAGTSTGTVLAKRIGMADALGLDLIGGRARFTVTTGATRRTLVAPQVVTDGRWHHVAATYDARVIRMYLDGVPATQSFATGRAQLGNAATTVGARVVNNFAEGWLTGDLADLAVWGVALTEADVNRHYRGGVARGVFPGTGAALVYHFDLAGQRVVDATSRGVDGQLGLTPDAESDDPSSAVLRAPVDASSSGLVAVTVRLVEPTGGMAGALITTSSTAVGTPLPVGYRAFGGRACNAPLGSPCNSGEAVLTADNVGAWDGGRRRAYHLEIDATDAAGNRSTTRVAFRVQDYAGALGEAITRAQALADDPLNFSAINELSSARNHLEAARGYTSMARRYADGSYLRADQGVEGLLDARDLNVDIGQTAVWVSRAMAGDVSRYVGSLAPSLVAEDRPMYTGAQLLLGDARFMRYMGRTSDLVAYSRSAQDTVALLYPAYQAMRGQRRTAHARWEEQIADFAAGRVQAGPMRTDPVRLIRTQALAAATRDMLSNTLYPEITAALASPFTTERRSLEEIRDVLDKNSMATDEEGDLIAITNPAIDNACLDRLASLTLDDRTFTRCYLRLNDLARLLDGVSEPLVHTYRWRAGLAVALFNMLEISMHISPTGIPWVTSDAVAPDVQLVLPDVVAARTPGSLRVSQVDAADGALARAYARYDAALVELREGDVNTAWSIFVDERCLLLGLYNRYYSMNRAVPNVADPKEAPIDPMTVGCGPR